MKKFYRGTIDWSMKKIMGIKSKNVSAESAQLFQWFVYMMKMKKGNETCSWHCDTIDNFIATRTWFWTKQQALETLQHPHNPKSTDSLAMRNDRLLSRIERAYRLFFLLPFGIHHVSITNVACLLLKQNRYVIDIIFVRLNWSSIDIEQNYYNDNVKNVIDYYLEFNHGISRRQTFSKNEKLLVTQEILLDVHRNVIKILKSQSLRRFTILIRFQNSL